MKIVGFQTDKQAERREPEVLCWYVVESGGDGAQAVLVHESELRNEIHRQMCACDATRWDECPTVGIAADIKQIDNEEEWTHYYPNYMRQLFEFKYEDGYIRILKLSKNPESAMIVKHEPQRVTVQ